MKILIVDGGCSPRENLVRDLKCHGFESHGIDNGRRALEECGSADLIVLDLELPDLDGLTVCREIRAAGAVPIIAVTSSDAELDRVLGLQAGADACMTKPFGLRELIARIEAIARRTADAAHAAWVVSRGPLHIDALKRQAHLHGRPVELTRKEFDLLWLLASRSGAVVSREQLMAEVWDDHWAKNGRTIDTHVSSLRSKLGKSTWVTTVRGVGYRFGSG